MDKQVKLSAEQLEKLQQVELDILIEIDRICKKTNIKYTLIGGSLLGAIRHQGFIPWDDDADVAMLRKEYDKFVKACEVYLDKEKFYFQDMYCTSGYRWGYAKMRKKDTLFLRCGQEHMPYEQGIFVDIFPVDNVPDNVILQKLQNLHCFCIRKIMWSEVGKKIDKKIILRLWYYILCKIPEKVIKQHMRGVIQQYNRKETVLGRTLLYPLSPQINGYNREWYINTEEILFEGIWLQATIYSKQYLIVKYGKDYMQLPEAEKRKCHPVTSIDFGEK